VHPNPHRCIPHSSPLACTLQPRSIRGKAGSLEGLLCSARTSPFSPHSYRTLLSKKKKRTRLLHLKPDPNNVSLPVSLSMIPIGTETLFPPPLSLPPSLFQAHKLFPSSLHACLILITVALKTRECRTWGHAAEARHLDECLMETLHLVQLQAMGLHVPALTDSLTQARPHSTPLSISRLWKWRKGEGETRQECRRLIYQISWTAGWCAGPRSSRAVSFLKTIAPSFSSSQIKNISALLSWAVLRLIRQSWCLDNHSLLHLVKGYGKGGEGQANGERSQATSLLFH